MPIIQSARNAWVNSLSMGMVSILVGPTNGDFRPSPEPRTDSRPWLGSYVVDSKMPTMPTKTEKLY